MLSDGLQGHYCTQQLYNIFGNVSIAPIRPFASRVHLYIFKGPTINHLGGLGPDFCDRNFCTFSVRFFFFFRDAPNKISFSIRTTPPQMINGRPLMMIIQCFQNLYTY